MGSTGYKMRSLGELRAAPGRPVPEEGAAPAVSMTRPSRPGTRWPVQWAARTIGARNKLVLRLELIVCSAPMDALPNPIQSVLQLFEASLSEVRFADIDVKALARAAADVKDVAAVVASAQAALDSARAALEERQEALLQKVQRALAYARVYAENDEALRQKLDAIRLPRPTRAPRAIEDVDLVLSPPPAPAPRPRGRPRKVAVEQMQVHTPPAEGPSAAEHGQGGAAMRTG
jgi:hypothetical protein